MGNYVYIADLENKHCSVAILRRYIETYNFDLSSHLPLFRPLTKNESVYGLRNGKLSYITLRNMAYIVCVLGVLQLLSVITLPKPFLRGC